MTRILLRAPKDPFEVIGPERSAPLLGSNSGNLLFAEGVHHALSRPDSAIDTLPVHRVQRLTPDQLAHHNETYDVLVLPMANAFRADFVPTLEWLTHLIRGLDIPVVVVGVGTGLPDGVTEMPSGIRQPVADFVGAVLDRSTSIGVRGEVTAAALAHLGFGSEVVDVIGCPSLFGPGRTADFTWHSGALGVDSPIAVNATLRMQRSTEILTHSVARHPHLTYLPQHVDELRLMMTGAPITRHGDLPASVPLTLDHPAHRDHRAKFFVDARPWRDFLATQSFSFGSRLHGTIAALTAGVPSILATEGSRTSEVADYHHIPSVPLRSLAEDEDLIALYEHADPSAHVAHRGETFARYLAFLDRNNLPHVHGSDNPHRFEGDGNPDWEDRLARTQFSDPVDAAWSTGTDEGASTAGASQKVRSTLSGAARRLRGLIS